MPYSPQIAEAKRRARAAARTTGASYQSKLEDEARALGYGSWSDLLSGKPAEESFESHSPNPETVENPDLRAFGPWRSLTRPMTMIWIACFMIIVCVALAIAGAARSSEAERVMKDGFLQNEEKTLAAVLPGLDFADIERVSYVTSWKISLERRKVHITIYDWRSIPESLRKKMGERYRDVPLVRLQGIVDCKKGILENPNLYSASDLVSPALRKITEDAPAEKLTEMETAVMCSQDTLRRTKDIEAIRQE